MNLKPNILVTGGTGLVGSHLLANLCLQGFTVRAIYRKQSSLIEVKKVFSFYTQEYEKLFQNIEWKMADITEIPSLNDVFQGITIVYHCAALVSFKNNDYEKMRKINIEGTANMINFSIDHQVEKFCFVSSIASIDKNSVAEKITEQNEWNPENNNYGYAITKYGGEMEVWRGTQEGLKAIIVNPGVILGSGFWENNTGKFFKNADNNFKYYTNGITGFIGVQDVVKAMIQLTESQIENERYILVAENKSFRYVLTEIGKKMGKKSPSVYVSPLMSEIAWRLAGIISFFSKKPALITKHSARAAHQKYYYSSEKIIDAIAFEFETLDKVIAVCVDHYQR